VGRILGTGRGRRNANYALTGFNYLQDNPVVQQTQDFGAGANSLLAGALGIPE